MKQVMIGIFLNIFFVCSSYALNLPDAKLTIKAVDENDQPVSGAEGSITFEVPKFGKQGLSFPTKKGMTGVTGTFTASNNTVGEVAFGFKKEGYYKSTGVYRFTQRRMGRWEPWNSEITVRFRKIDNPVPMYARNSKMSTLEIPILGKAVGFDLIEYAWLPPYGKGKYADVIFRVDRRVVSEEDFDCTLTITFPNKHDGIQLYKENLKNGSAFKLPRYAPESGYLQKMTRMRRGEPDKPVESDFEEDNNYMFRVRSEEMAGKLVRAMYGKIQGDIRIDPRGTKTAAILFKYYLNPDYTRNLEYDPSRNRFLHLSSTEQVGL